MANLVSTLEDYLMRQEYHQKNVVRTLVYLAGDVARFLEASDAKSTQLELSNMQCRLQGLKELIQKR